MQEEILTHSPVGYDSEAAQAPASTSEQTARREQIKGHHGPGQPHWSRETVVTPTRTHTRPKLRKYGDLLRGFVQRHWKPAWGAVAMMIDFCLLLASLGIASLLSPSAFGGVKFLAGHVVFFVICLAVYLLCFAASGFYRTITQSAFQEQIVRGITAFSVGSAAVASLLVLFKLPSEFRSLAVRFVPIGFILYTVVWTLLAQGVRLLQKHGLGRMKTLAIGSPPYLDLLLKRLDRFPELGYDVVDVIRTPYNASGDGMLHVDRALVERITHDKKIQLILLSTAELNGSYDPLDSICRSRQIRMRVIAPDADLVMANAGIHDLGGIPLFIPQPQRLDTIKRVCKRGLDLIGAVLCLILLSPVFVITMIAIRLESRGPIFFTQKRSLSDHDRPFRFIKFRSMYREADQQRESLLTRNESDGVLFKLRDDPRITRVGKVIRRYSIDELPQLINVLRGEMSLVGPRPLPVRDFARVRDQDHLGGIMRQRSHAKPGMTGLWQISGRSDLGFREMLLLDLYYIEHQSILYDIEILARTIPIVVFGKGAY